MDAVHEFFEAYNSGMVDRLLQLVDHGYTYREPLFSDLLDAQGHVALMSRIFDAAPHRQMQILDRITGVDGEIFRASLTRTSKHTGDVVSFELFMLFDVDEDSGLITRARGYYNSAEIR